MGVVEAGDENLVPQGVKLVAAGVEELGEVLVQVARRQAVMATAGLFVFCFLFLFFGSLISLVGLINLELIQVAVQELHVAHVAAEADNRSRSEGADALNVVEAGQAAVRGQVVGGENDTVAELEAQDGSTGDGGGLGGGFGLRVVEVRVVVGAVDVVAGTAPGLWSVIHLGGKCTVVEKKRRERIRMADSKDSDFVAVSGVVDKGSRGVELEGWIVCVEGLFGNDVS